MAARRGDVVGIAGIIAAERALGLGAEALGIVDDMGQRRAQSLIEALAERGAGARRERLRRSLLHWDGFGLRDRRTAEPCEIAAAVDQGDAGEAVAGQAATAQLDGLAVKAAMLGQSGQDRQAAVRIFEEAEQAGELLADEGGGRGADGRTGAGRQSGEAQAVVRLPGPVGGGAQEIGLTLLQRRRRGRARRAADPAGDGEGDLRPFRRGADPEIQILLAIGGDGGARDGDAEALGKAGKRGDLRHGEHAAGAATGLRLQSRQLRIGLDQPAIGVEPAGNDLRLAAHAASAAGRPRVETRATAAR